MSKKVEKRSVPTQSLQDTQPMKAVKHKERRNLRLRLYSYISIGLLVLLAYREDVKIDTSFVGNIFSKDASALVTPDPDLVPNLEPTLTLSPTPTLIPTLTPTPMPSPTGTPTESSVATNQHATLMAVVAQEQAAYLMTQAAEENERIKPTKTGVPSTFISTPTPEQTEQPGIESEPTRRNVGGGGDFVEECLRFFDESIEADNYYLESAKSLLAAFGAANLLVGVDNYQATRMLSTIIYDLEEAIAQGAHCEVALAVAQVRFGQAFANVGNYVQALREFERAREIIDEIGRDNFTTSFLHELHNGICITYEGMNDTWMYNRECQ